MILRSYSTFCFETYIYSCVLILHSTWILRHLQRKKWGLYFMFYTCIWWSNAFLCVFVCSICKYVHKCAYVKCECVEHNKDVKGYKNVSKLVMWLCKAQCKCINVKMFHCAKKNMHFFSGNIIACLLCEAMGECVSAFASVQGIVKNRMCKCESVNMLIIHLCFNLCTKF